MTISLNSNITSVELCDDALNVIFSSKQLYSPPFVINKSNNDPRFTVHVLMAVSKQWQRIMHELIVPLLNNRTIQWSYLPLVMEDKAFSTPDNPIHKFLLQPINASGLKHLDLRKIKEVHGDRLGEITALCINVQALFLSHCYFDLNHLKPLLKLKVFSIAESNLLNASALGSCSSLENLRVEKCSGVYWKCFNSKLKNIYIYSKFFNHIENLPPLLTSLTLFNTDLKGNNPFQLLTQLKHLSVHNQFQPLEPLSSLESLEITCNLLPDQYLESASQVRRLKISRSNNLPDFASFKNLTQLFLRSINFPEISALTNLTELTMDECLYSSETFTKLTSLKKLTLRNYSWESRYRILAFYKLPHMETLHINSRTLTKISVRGLTSLQCLKINCKSLQELALPPQTLALTDLDISKTVRRQYSEHGYKVMQFT